MSSFNAVFSSTNTFRECLAVLQGHTSAVSCLQLLPSSFISESSNGRIIIWSLNDYSELRQIEAHKSAVIGLKCDGSRILSGSSDGQVRIWDLESGDLLENLASSEAVWSVGFLSEMKAVAVFLQKKQVILQVGQKQIAHAGKYMPDFKATY